MQQTLVELLHFFVPYNNFLWFLKHLLYQQKPVAINLYQS